VKKQLPRHEIGIGRKVSGTFDAVVARTEAALKEQGFGVLTRIDVKATMKERLDVDVPSNVILGACNPPLAHQALTIEPRVGLLLPCNVVVRQDGKAVRVEAIEPFAMVEMFPDSDLNAVAAEASDRLRRAIEAI
jgi:uncharacterized protein (DUF302 family)